MGSPHRRILRGPRAGRQTRGRGKVKTVLIGSVIHRSYRISYRIDVSGSTRTKRGGARCRPRCEPTTWAACCGRRICSRHAAGSPGRRAGSRRGPGDRGSARTAGGGRSDRRHRRRVPPALLLLDDRGAVRRDRSDRASCAIIRTSRGAARAADADAGRAAVPPGERSPRSRLDYVRAHTDSSSR